MSADPRNVNNDWSSMTSAEKFATAFVSLRRMLAATSVANVEAVFCNVATEVAGYTRRGLAKQEAVEQLTSIAADCNIKPERVEQIIDAAFDGNPTKRAGRSPAF